MKSVIKNYQPSGATYRLKPEGGVASISKAKEPVEQLLEQERAKAFQEGLKQGTQAGYESAMKEVQTHIHFLQKISVKLLEEKEALFQRLRPEIVELCMAICEKLLRKQLANSQTFIQVIRSLISSLPFFSKQEAIHVLLCEEDFRMIEKELSSLHLDCEGLEFHADSLLERGDVRIETKLGIMNCSLNRELENLQSQILQI